MRFYQFLTEVLVLFFSLIHLVFSVIFNIPEGIGTKGGHVLMSRSLVGKKNKEASEALSAVSKLLSRLATSRKAQSKLQDIIALTKEVARLGRAVNGYGSEYCDGADDGYGDPHHFTRISAMKDATNVIR